MQNHKFLVPTLLACALLATISDASAQAVFDCYGRNINQSSHLAPALDQAECAPPQANAASNGFSFAPYLATRTSSFADAVAIGDVNGDSKKDVVLSTTFYFDPINDYKAFIFPQLANGFLGSPTKLSYGQTANRNGIAVKQLDGQFGLDIAIGGGRGVSTLFADGLGGFTSAAIFGSKQANLLATSSVPDVSRFEPSIIMSVGWSNEGEYMLPSPPGNYVVTPWAPQVQGYNGIAQTDLDGDRLEDVALSSGQGLGQNISWYKKYRP